MDNNLNETEINVNQNSVVQVDITNDSSVDVGVSAERSVIRGVDGFSPIAKVTQEADGAKISITDIDGTTTANVFNGARGEKGERGERGEQGIQGERGEQGIQGERGEQGIQGERGEQGIQGERGEQGIQGERGEQGIQGIQGERGEQGIQGIQGERGERGEQGIQGVAGADGFSPIATVTKSGNTATISITDKNGTTTASVSDGTNGINGTNGQDGFSPIASVTQTGGVTTISITDENGTTTESITVPTKTSDLTNDGASGSSTYVESSELSSYVTLGTNQNITGEKTFVGNKRIKFKGTASNSKLGFTAYDQNNGETGFLEVEGASTASKKIRLGCYDQNSGGNARDNYVGFQYYNTKPVGGGTVSYNLVCPPQYKGISGANSFAYIPIDFTDGTTTIRAGVDGVLNLSSLLPSSVTVVQTTGQSTTDVMSQKAVTDELDTKADTSSLATVATTGDYSDLSGKPTIPTVPTKTSELVNDGSSGTSTYLQASDLALTNVTSSVTTGTSVRIDTGGRVMTFGNLVIVNMDITTSASINAYGVLLSGMPARNPNNFLWLSITDGNNANKTYRVYYDGGVIRTRDALPAGTYGMSFVYIKA